MAVPTLSLLVWECLFSRFSEASSFSLRFAQENKKNDSQVFFMICFCFSVKLSTVTSQIMNAILSLFGLDLTEILSQDF